MASLAARISCPMLAAKATRPQRAAPKKMIVRAGMKPQQHATVSTSRRGFGVSLAVAATVFTRNGPALASFGPPDAAQYLADTSALVEMGNKMAEREAVDLKAYNAAGEAWLGSYKRQHAEHTDSYNAVYTAVSMVKFSNGAMDSEKREKMGRLMGEATAALNEEYA